MYSLLFFQYVVLVYIFNWKSGIAIDIYLYIHLYLSNRIYKKPYMK